MLPNIAPNPNAVAAIASTNHRGIRNTIGPLVKRLISRFINHSRTNNRLRVPHKLRQPQSRAVHRASYKAPRYEIHTAPNTCLLHQLIDNERNHYENDKRTNFIRKPSNDSIHSDLLHCLVHDVLILSMSVRRWRKASIS